MKKMSKEFKKISIRARVAYGICCLENALEYYGISGEGWSILLNKMWNFTTLSAATDLRLGILPLEKWMEVSGYKPNRSYFYGDGTYEDCYKHFVDCAETPPTKEVYGLLREAYNKDKNEVIEKLTYQIFQTGANELWAGIDDKSQITLDDLQEVIDAMNENNIPLPDMEPFRKYDFHKPGWDYDLHGWGETFDGKQYSKFLKPD